jgi:hypothetical protein
MACATTPNCARSAAHEPTPTEAEMTTDSPSPETAATVLLTIIFKHHEGLVLDDIQGKLKASDWWEAFPPAGARVVSWTVAMGLGQICTLEVPADQLGLVNLELERRAWGVFRTEVYATYDFVPVRERITARVRAGGQ